MDNYSRRLDGIFQALADPTRRAVIDQLGEGPASVTDLARPFAMALPSFMKHIHVLEQSGLIQTRKEGRVRTCAISPRAFTAIEQWLSAQRAAWESHADRLEQFVLSEMEMEMEEETS
jgi:DNA-binding transcriptional ArsR family regulator